MDQIRIVKEMREHDRSIRGSDVDIRSLSPRFLVWENVPGALSSGVPKGEDFRIVLEEIARVCEEDAVIPGPPKEGWHSAGCIMGNGWSIAWRVHDAQFWGVPQRRRRISLIADFGGGAAPDILFEKVLSVGESLSGDTEQSGTERERTAGDIEESIGETGGSIAFDAYNQAITGNVTKPLTNKATDSDHIPLAVKSTGESEQWNG